MLLVLKLGGRSKMIGPRLDIIIRQLEAKFGSQCKEELVRLKEIKAEIDLKMDGLVVGQRWEHKKSKTCVIVFWFSRTHIKCINKSEEHSSMLLRVFYDNFKRSR